MRRPFIHGFVVAIMAMSATAAHAQSGPGFLIAGFSYLRALEESTPGKAALAQLAVVRAQKQREIDERNRELSIRVPGFQRSLGTITGVQRDEQEQSLNRFRLDTGGDRRPEPREVVPQVLRPSRLASVPPRDQADEPEVLRWVCPGQVGTPHRVFVLKGG